LSFQCTQCECSEICLCSLDFELRFSFPHSSSFLTLRFLFLTCLVDSLISLHLQVNLFFFYFEWFLEMNSLLWYELGLVSRVLLSMVLFFRYLPLLFAELFLSLLIIVNSCVLAVLLFYSNLHLCGRFENYLRRLCWLLLTFIWDFFKLWRT
jgi:hypothetical protein